MTRGRNGNHAFVVVGDNRTAVDALTLAVTRDWIDQPAIVRRTELESHTTNRRCGRHCRQTTAASRSRDRSSKWITTPHVRCMLATMSMTLKRGAGGSSRSTWQRSRSVGAPSAGTPTETASVSAASQQFLSPPDNSELAQPVMGGGRDRASGVLVALLRGDRLCWAAAAASRDEVGGKRDSGGVGRFVVDELEEHLGSCRSRRGGVLVDGGEGRVEVRGDGDVSQAHQGQVGGDVKAVAVCGLDDSDGELIANARIAVGAGSRLRSCSAPSIPDWVLKSATCATYSD